MQTKTLDVRVFYSPSGEGTCCADGECCTFLRSTHFGTRDVCIFTDNQIYRKDDVGFTIPSIGCPLHSFKERKDDFEDEIKRST